MRRKPIALTCAALALSLVTAQAATPLEMSGVDSQPIFTSLPREAQNRIENVRASCREYLKDLEPDQRAKYSSVTTGAEGLVTFLVSGMTAVIVDDMALCGGECLRGANCTNRNSYGVSIYVRRGNYWTRELSTDAVGSVFLSVKWPGPPEFKALVLSVFSGNKDCPTHDVRITEKGETYTIPAWKQSCDALVKWDGKKFVYKPL
jgi:hypothetical protein